NGNDDEQLDQGEPAPLPKRLLHETNPFCTLGASAKRTIEPAQPSSRSGRTKRRAVSTTNAPRRPSALCSTHRAQIPPTEPGPGVGQDGKTRGEEHAGVRTPGPHAEAPGMRTGGPHSGNPSAA